MQKGVMFTAEAVYVIIVVFAAVMVFLASLPALSVPSYDGAQAMKVAHDMGQESTSSPPTGFSTSCDGKTKVKLAYYNSTQEVCMT